MNGPWPRVRRFTASAGLFVATASLFVVPIAAVIGKWPIS